MKRLIVIFVVVFMMVGFVACGDSDYKYLVTDEYRIEYPASYQAVEEEDLRAIGGDDLEFYIDSIEKVIEDDGLEFRINSTEYTWDVDEYVKIKINGLTAYRKDYGTSGKVTSVIIETHNIRMYTPLYPIEMEAIVDRMINSFEIIK